jgi:hypothetical protein
LGRTPMAGGDFMSRARAADAPYSWTADIGTIPW